MIASGAGNRQKVCIHYRNPPRKSILFRKVPDDPAGQERINREEDGEGNVVADIKVIIPVASSVYEMPDHREAFSSLEDRGSIELQFRKMGF